MTSATTQRHHANCNYFMRKWGCPAEQSNWMSSTHDCRFKTSFNRTVPHWFWHTNRSLRARDRWLHTRPVESENGTSWLLDTRTNELIFPLPKHYGTWEGYVDKARICRLSGWLGQFTGPDGRAMCR